MFLPKGSLVTTGALEKYELSIIIIVYKNINVKFNVKNTLSSNSLKNLFCRNN